MHSYPYRDHSLLSFQGYNYENELTLSEEERVALKELEGENYY
jgi:hypothetical protein